MESESKSSVLGLSLTFTSPGVPTPPSRLRRLNDNATKAESTWSGLPLDKIAERVFSAIKFDTHDCVVNGQSYSTIQNDHVRGALYRLFGPRLTISQLENNLTSLEKSHWGYLEGVDSTIIDLSRDIAHQRVADLCLLALSSLSPQIVSAVTAVLSTLADSVQSERSLLTRHVIEVTLYARNDRTLTLINSRLDVSQRGRKIMLCLCGASRMSMVLELQIRRIGFSRQFYDLLESDSPELSGRILNGVVLLPPSGVQGRAATAPV